MKNPSTPVRSHITDKKLYIKATSVIQTLKDDLLELLTHPEEDMFATEYLKDRIALLEQSFKIWEDEKNKANELDN